MEVFLATPNGASNSLFVPIQPASPVPLVAFDLNPTDSQSIDVFYQWLPGPDGKLALVSTFDPGAKKALNIKWDSNTGIGPKTLQVTFTGTINGQSLSFALTTDQGAKGDYPVSQQQFMVLLLKRLQEMVTAPAALGSPLTLTVNVQPWIPNDEQGLRVRTEGKELKSKLSVNLYLNSTGRNELQGVVIPAPPPPPPSPAPTSFLMPRRAPTASRPH